MVYSQVADARCKKGGSFEPPFFVSDVERITRLNFLRQVLLRWLTR